jgi:hypothetical protein
MKARSAALLEVTSEKSPMIAKPQPVAHKFLEHFVGTACPQLKEIWVKPRAGDDNQSGCVRHRLSNDRDCILIVA